MIILMGVSGAGKGTQSEKLIHESGYAYLSTGEALRLYASSEQQARMLAGELLGDDEIIALVNSALEHMADASKSILDGFPRTIPQAEWLLEQVKAGRFTVGAVFNLVVTPETVFKRLQSRGRPDDTEVAISRRVETHRRVTQPVIQMFKDHGLLVYDIDGTQSPEDVHEVIMRHIKEQGIF